MTKPSTRNTTHRIRKTTNSNFAIAAAPCRDSCESEQPRDHGNHGEEHDGNLPGLMWLMRLMVAIDSCHSSYGAVCVPAFGRALFFMWESADIRFRRGFL